MHFVKKALTVDEQIDLLESRGMIISDRRSAARYLSNIGYYRLSAYWFTFLEMPKANHAFKKGTTFEHAISTYVFDRKLRLLIFDAIERIEIALRTQLIYHCCLELGSNWYEDVSLFKNMKRHEYFYKGIQIEMDRTVETFIQHYKEKYTFPINPPGWMTLELAPLGQLSKLFKNLKTCPSKKRVAEHFKIHEVVLESWFETLCYVRNTCAHHSRIWNRKMPKPPTFPKTTFQPWITYEPSLEKKNLIYSALAVMAYLLNSFLPKSSFRKKLISLIDEYPNIPQHYMGFPPNWIEDPFWN